MLYFTIILITTRNFQLIHLLKKDGVNILIVIQLKKKNIRSINIKINNYSINYLYLIISMPDFLHLSNIFLKVNYNINNRFIFNTNLIFLINVYLIVKKIK